MDLKETLRLHKMWLIGKNKGERANLTGADLREADLSRANLTRAVLTGANLSRADLRWAVLTGANLSRADLREADLREADLRWAILTRADLHEADLTGVDLTGVDLTGVDLREVKGLIKLMGVSPGNTYYKRFGEGLKNNYYQFYVGRNDLREGETFAADERELCSYPGFYFASRSWCAVHYGERPLEALIRIPDDAQINEPWATDGKASASSIEILQVFDVRTGEDVTNQFLREEEK